MKVYTTRAVAKLLDLSVGQVRSYARAGLLEPERGPRGEYRFSFQDLVLLRTAKGLLAARIPARKVRTALRRLQDQLPRGEPLAGVQLSADGERVVVRDGDMTWDAESGQAQLNFELRSPVRTVAPHTRRLVRRSFQTGRGQLDADDWYSLGNDLEPNAPDHAREAYRRALDLDPNHVETRVNLGRLLHEEGRYNAAEAHYRLALSVRPADPTALFNLGVCLEDQGRTDAAVETYRRTIEAAPECADAYYNLARLHEKQGESAAALRHLKTYRKLTES